MRLSVSRHKIVSKSKKIVAGLSRPCCLEGIIDIWLDRSGQHQVRATSGTLSTVTDNPNFSSQTDHGVPYQTLETMERISPAHFPI